MTPGAGAASTPGGSGSAARSPTALRADAARNVAQIRAAAIAAFHGRGLGTPLEEIASAAGVSKATIYNRFGGRQGLIDAVIEELVGAEMRSIVDRAGQPGDPWERLATYVTDLRDLQYREPAAVDVILMAYPRSAQVNAQWQLGRASGIALVEQAHQAGVIRADFTPDDLYQALVANGLALRHRPKPGRQDYDRRGRFLLDGIRPHR
ncbi:MAG TPA: TetR/AcrR family transcriptional regulator [Streptosporangiaceae bacterium]